MLEFLNNLTSFSTSEKSHLKIIVDALEPFGDFFGAIADMLGLVK
ncbi:hypothetical protein [Corynebacterium aquilae]|nr:hypothetical protein [Corynebacterium aquilae]